MKFLCFFHGGLESGYELPLFLHADSAMDMKFLFDHGGLNSGYELPVFVHGWLNSGYEIPVYDHRVLTLDVNFLCFFMGSPTVVKKFLSLFFGTQHWI